MEEPLAKFCIIGLKESFLHGIVTADEKLIYYESPKQKRSSVDLAQKAKSTGRPNRFGMKAMLLGFWDQHDVFGLSF